MRRKWLVGCGASLFLFLGFLLAVAVVSARKGSGRLGSDRIGVVEIRGFIADHRSATEALRDFRKDPKTRAVVVRVESPGGLVAPSQEIHDEVRRTAKEKPVVVSMGALAASGGYYLSAPATRILANPGTATGSIGVVLQFRDVHELLGKLGLKAGVVKSGPMKDAGSPFRAMKPEERQLFQGLVDDLFSQFVDAVAQGRRMKRDRVVALADGRVYSGKQALELGLVDQLGGFWDAVTAAQGLAKLDGEPNLQYRGGKTGGILRLLLGETATQSVAALDDLSANPLRYVLPGW